MLKMVVRQSVVFQEFTNVFGSPLRDVHIVASKYKEDIWNSCYKSWKGKE